MSSDTPILSFPPFPSAPVGVVSFQDYNVQGVTKKASTMTGVIRLAVSEKHAHPSSSKRRSTKGGVRIAAVDAWKIGSDTSEWTEPVGTSICHYDIGIPPFARLLMGTREFLYSRFEGFNPLSRRLFDLLRHHLGLRSEFPGRHWSGSGENAQDYVGPSRTQGLDPASSESEVCCLLRQTVRSVRGVLALARQETDATWETEHAELFADITSAFIAFIVHYQVLPEVDLQTEMSKALVLTRGAKRQLQEARNLELALERGWNACCYAALSPDPSRSSEVRSESDHGGWNAKERLPPRTQDVMQARLFLETLGIKLPLTLLEHIPYSRRRIETVDVSTEGDIERGIEYYNLNTKAAPWTPEEKWRTLTADRASLPVVPLPNPQYDQISLKIDAEGLPHLHRMQGMGLRGEWLYVTDGIRDPWWIFRAKDVVLPAFWQSSAAASGITEQ